MILSVIMPVYNVESTVGRAIESVLNQTLKDFELILVNDGSTDNSFKVCEYYAVKDNRIKLIQKKNGGLSSARNKGIEIANGEYITFIDSDDYIDSEIYLKFKNEIDKKKVDLFIFNICRVRNNREEVLKSEDLVLNKTEDIIESLFEYKGIDFYAWNKIYKRNLFKDVRYPEGRIYEDIIPSYEVAKRSTIAVITKEVGYYYIDNTTSIVNSNFKANQYDNVLQRELLLNRIRKDYPQFETKATAKLLDGFLSTGYKVASADKNEVTSEYIGRLRNDIKKYQSKMFYNKDLSKLKIAALILLKFNLPLYSFLYKRILKK